MKLAQKNTNNFQTEGVTIEGKIASKWVTTQKMKGNKQREGLSHMDSSERIRFESGSLDLVPLQTLRHSFGRRLDFLRDQLNWSFQRRQRDVPDEWPVDAFEERVRFDITGAAVRAEPLQWTPLQKVSHQLPHLQAHRNAGRKDDVLLEDIGECFLPVLPSEWGSTIKHLINQDT